MTISNDLKDVVDRLEFDLYILALGKFLNYDFPYIYSKTNELAQNFDQIAKQLYNK